MEFHKIFRVVAKWLDNNGYKISLQTLESWLTGYQKGNFHFEPSSTVGQAIELTGQDIQLFLYQINLQNALVFY